MFIVQQKYYRKAQTSHYFLLITGYESDLASSKGGPGTVISNSKWNFKKAEWLYCWSWEFILVLFLSSIAWEHHSYFEHAKYYVLLLVYVPNSNGLDLVIFMKPTAEGNPDAYPKAALECMTVMPADFLSQLYVPVSRVYRCRNPALLSRLSPLGLKSFPGCLGVAAEQDLLWHWEQWMKTC